MTIHSIPVALETKSAETDPIAEVKTALQGLTEDITKKTAPVADLATRLDEIEAKLARPNLGGKAKPEEKDEEAELEGKAFDNFVRHGVEHMDADEVKALSVSTDTAGGYLVPDDFQAELIKNLVLYSPMRQIARVSQTSGSTVLLPKRTGKLTASWVAEGAARSSTEPTYGQQTLTVYELGCYVDISNQLLEDSAFDMAGELAMDFAEEFGRAEGAAFVDGTGSGQPAGLLGTSGIGGVSAAADDAITTDEIIDLFHALPSFYAANGTWIANRSTIGAIRKLKNSSGDYLWREAISEANPATVLGRPIIEMPDMPDIEAEAIPLAFGDFRQGFRIFDRVNLSVLRDPYSVQVNGQVRFHGRRRTTGGVVKAEAIKFLTMASA